MNIGVCVTAFQSSLQELLHRHWCWLVTLWRFMNLANFYYTFQNSVLAREQRNKFEKCLVIRFQQYFKLHSFPEITNINKNLQFVFQKKRKLLEKTVFLRDIFVWNWNIFCFYGRITKIHNLISFVLFHFYF
jgi:hypothetical protein